MDVRRRVVDAYLSGRSGTYEETAALFGVGRATVSRLLWRKRETGDVVIMDNLSAHKNAVVRCEAIEERGAEILFLPACSPELDPIEQAWAKLKDIFRRLPTRTRSGFDDAEAFALGAITDSDIRAWTQHVGYQLTPA